jgi:hypothetical protein
VSWIGRIARGQSENYDGGSDFSVKSFMSADMIGPIVRILKCHDNLSGATISISSSPRAGSRFRKVVGPIGEIGPRHDLLSMLGGSCFYFLLFFFFFVSITKHANRLLPQAESSAFASGRI